MHVHSTPSAALRLSVVTVDRSLLSSEEVLALSDWETALTPVTPDSFLCPLVQLAELVQADSLMCRHSQELGIGPFY